MADGWASATPLRNSDFKALLATPRPAHLAPLQPRERRPKPARGEGGDGEKKGKFKKPGPRGRPGKPGKEGDAEKDEGPTYRDRAKERREGVDFAEPEVELAARGVAPVALASLSIEQSKFLGGDIEHTHLVKGLDYALLHHERAKLEADKAKAAEAAAAAKAAALLPRGVAAEAARFTTAAGRAVYDALFRPPPANRALLREMFQPRRTAFVFEFGDLASDVPTTLRRSKADCPPVQDLVCAADDGAVLERITKIMAYLSASGAGRPGKAAARDAEYIRALLSGATPGAPGDAQVHGQLVMKGQAAIAPSGGSGGSGGGAAGAAAAGAAAAGAAAAGAADGAAAGAAAAAAGPKPAPEDDDDIFGEAGTDYAPALPAKKGDAAAQQRRPEGGLFASNEHVADLRAPPPALPADVRGGEGEVDMDVEEGQLPGARRTTAADAAAAAAAAAAGVWQRPAEVPKWRVAAKPGAGGGGGAGFADEAYAECFPSMAEMAEDDEEGAPEKPGAPGAEGADGADGAAAGALAKGGKGKAKAKAGGMDDAERKLNQKLSREVHQMQGIFKEKGWGSEAAFRKPDKLDAVTATPARKRLRL
ncbi:SMU2 [Scenedesmus sp. PABB004]|nr:SMU2 [Scenedesmus sp. PABB004]